MAPVVRMAAVGLVVLAVFGALYAQTLGAYGMLMWDEAEYAVLGRSLASGDGYVINGHPEQLRPPVLPLGVAASIWLAGQADDRVAKRASVGFALCGLAILYVFGARLRSHGTGLAAAVLLGTMPWFWTATANVLSELPFLVFFTAGVCGLYAGWYLRPVYLYVGWLGFALAMLTRYTAVLYGPVLVAVLAAAWWSGDRDVRARVLSRHTVLAPLVALAVLAPWFVRQALVFGDPLVGLWRAATQLQVYMPGVEMPWHFYLGALVRMVSVPTLVLAGVGVVLTLRMRDRRGLHAFLIVLGFVLWFSCYRYKEDRMVSAALPFVAVLAGAAVDRIGTACGRWRTVVVMLLLVGIAVFNSFGVRYYFNHAVTLGYPTFTQAMQDLRERSDPAAVVVGTSYPQIAWYAERRVVDFPDETQLAEVLEHADWVVITNFERGQPDYVQALLRRLTKQDFRSGVAVLRTDRRFATVLVRADVLRGRL